MGTGGSVGIGASMKMDMQAMDIYQYNRQGERVWVVDKCIWKKVREKVECKVIKAVE